MNLEKLKFIAEMQARFADIVLTLSPPYRVYVALTSEGLEFFCLEMMGVVNVCYETIFLFMNPTWYQLYLKDENEFLGEIVNGLSHESIHQAFFRMGKPYTSGVFDRINGSMQHDDYTGTATEEYLKEWQLQQIAKHPNAKRVMWHV